MEAANEAHTISTILHKEKNLTCNLFNLIPSLQSISHNVQVWLKIKSPYVHEVHTRYYGWPTEAPLRVARSQNSFPLPVF